jgi:hypothetical protein
MMKKIMDAAAIIGNVVGAMLIAVGNNDVQILGYVFFCVGCGSSIWLLRQSTASKSLMYVSIYFLITNIVGIIARVPGIFA